MAEAEYDERNDPNSPNYAPDEDLPPPEDDPAFDDDGKPKKRRKWPWVVLVLLLLLGLLVLFLPTIANTPPVRAFVLEKVNDQLNGTLEVTDWSLGWTGNTEITGVRITQNGAQVLAARRLFTELSLLDVIKGDWNLGTTIVEDLTFVFKQYPDGTNNFQKLPKQPSSGEPIILPDFRGDVDVTFWGSITQADGTLITLDKSRLNAKFDSINGPIAHDLDVTARIAGATPGKLAAKGQIDLFEDGKVNVQQLVADETAELREFPLDSISPLFPAGGPVSTLKGLTSGKLQLKLQGASEVFVQGDLTSEDFALGGPALAGDTLRDKLVTITIPETRYDRASGRLRTRQAGSQPQQIVVKMKQLGSIALGVNAPLPGITNALSSKAPGTDGRVVFNADLNVEAANQLPNLLSLPPGLRITSGALRADAELLLESKAAHVKGQVNLTELGGIDRNRREVYAEPIQLTYNATSLGGGGAIPDLRDLRLSLNSGFANVQGQGESLSRVSLTGSTDLAKFRDQIGQFVELGLKQLAGQVVFDVNTVGNLATVGGKSSINATVTGTNIVYQPMEGEAIKEPWARLTAKGELLRGEEQFVEEINDAAISAQTGNEQKPTVDAHVSGDVVFAVSGPASATFLTAPNFETRMSVDLAAMQREFGALLNPLRERGLTFTQGLLIASGAGAYDGATVKVSAFNAATQNVSLTRLVANRPPATVLADYSATVDLAGAFRNDAGGLDARVSSLSWSDAKKILSIAEVGDGDLVVQMAGDGARRIDGKVRLAADLKALNDILGALGDRPLEAVADTRAGQLRQGELSGTLAFTPAEQQHTLLTGDLAVNNLSVTTNDKPIENEQVTLVLRVRADDTFSTVAAQQVNLKSSFLTAAVKDTDLRLAGPTPDAQVSPLDVVQRGAVTWTVPDLPRAVSIARAFMPEAEVEVGDDDPPAEPGDPAAPRPLEVRSGTLSGALRLDRNDDGITLTLDQLTGQRIVLNRGKGQFGPEDVNVKLAVLIRTNPPAPATRPVAEDIQEIRVTQFAGDVAVANVALEEPIVIRDPGGMTQASGAIKIDGQVRTLTDLLRTLEYLPSENTDKFDGAYTVTQRLTTQQQTIGLAGQLNIQNFVAGQFREKLVRFANDLQLDQSKKALNIRNFALNLEESQAFSVKATGSITDYNTDRRFQNTRALVSYDAAKLPDLIRPLLDPATQEHIKSLKLSGVVRDEPFVIDGRYPAAATQPAAEDERQRDPIQYVTAHGRLAFETFEYEGLPGKNLVIPLMLDNGRLSTVYPQKDKQYPEPATFSRGRLDVGGLQVHLAANATRFSSMRENHKVLDRVVVNRAIVERYLGQAHPLFTGADEARGVVTLTVNELDRLPIGERLKRPGRKEDGRAKVSLAINDLRLKTFFLGQVLGTLKVVQVEPDGTVRTSIPDASFAIERGVVNSNLALNLGGAVLGFRDGSVRLRDNQIVSMNMLIPKALIPALRDEPAIKEFITVPVTGSLARPQFDIVKAAIQNSGITNPLDLLKRLQGDQGAGGASGSDRIGGAGTTPDRRNTTPEPPPREQPRNPPPNRPRGRQPR